MNDKMKKLLKEAAEARKYHRFEDALAILHQIVNNCTENNLTYMYLLASTYFEAGSTDAAEQYALEILEIDPNSKEALELLGLIATQKKKYKEAESFYLQALEIDENFHNARMNLIDLYDEHLLDDEKIEYHCQYMLSHRDTNRDQLPVRSRLKIYNEWLGQIVGQLIRCSARQQKYNEAIKYTRESIDLYVSFQKRYRITDNINDYGDIYKFYFLMGDKKGMTDFKQEFKELYPGLSDYDYFFSKQEKWALEKYKKI